MMSDADTSSFASSAATADGSLSTKVASGKFVLKKAASAKRVGGFTGEEDNDEESKPRRAVVPIDYTGQ
jgi:hypothetical protein